MAWKKKKRLQGMYEKYSLIKKLEEEEKIDNHFQVILNSLTLEEIITVKLELANKAAGNRLYGFPMMKIGRHMMNDAMLKTAISMARTKQEAMSFLGLFQKEYEIYMRKYRIDDYFDRKKEGE